MEIVAPTHRYAPLPTSIVAFFTLKTKDSWQAWHDAQHRIKLTSCFINRGRSLGWVETQSWISEGIKNEFWLTHTNCSQDTSNIWKQMQQNLMDWQQSNFHSPTNWHIGPTTVSLPPPRRKSIIKCERDVTDYLKSSGWCFIYLSSPKEDRDTKVHLISFRIT